VTDDELKLRTKQFAQKQLRAGQLLISSFEVARPSLQITALLVALALELSSSPKWALSLKRQMKPICGWN
jgi:hypothetical protein